MNEVYWVHAKAKNMEHELHHHLLNVTTNLKQ